MSEKSGLIGTLKFVVMLAIVAVAALAILLVLGVVTTETFQDLSLKLLMVGGIVVAAGGAIAFLVRE
jgi:hypothetical protein